MSTEDLEVLPLCAIHKPNMESQVSIRTGTRKRKATTHGGPATKRSKLTLTKVNAKVNRLIRAQDKKHYDSAYKWNEASPIPLFKATGTATVLNPIAQGDGESNRDGNRAFMESLLLRYHIRLVDSKLATYRLLVIWDNSLESGVTPDKYLDFSGTIDGEEALAPINLGEGKEFKVLYDDTNGLGAGCNRQVSVAGASVDMVTDVTCKKFIKIGEQSRWFNDASINPTSGGIVLVTLGNQWATPTGTPIQNGTLVARVRYTD